MPKADPFAERRTKWTSQSEPDADFPRMALGDREGQRSQIVT